MKDPCSVLNPLSPIPIPRSLWKFCYLFPVFPPRGLGSLVCVFVSSVSIFDHLLWIQERTVISGLVWTEVCDITLRQQGECLWGLFWVAGGRKSFYKNFLWMWHLKCCPSDLRKYFPDSWENEKDHIINTWEHSRLSWKSHLGVLPASFGRGQRSKTP